MDEQVGSFAGERLTDGQICGRVGRRQTSTGEWFDGRIGGLAGGRTGR